MQWYEITQQKQIGKGTYGTYKLDVTSDGNILIRFPMGGSATAKDVKIARRICEQFDAD